MPLSITANILLSTVLLHIGTTTLRTEFSIKCPK
jgi:hypothetical protein